MDKELQQLLDEARANGASVEQLDDIYNRYVKKKKVQNLQVFRNHRLYQLVKTS